VTEKIRQEVQQALEQQDATLSLPDLDSTVFTPMSMPYTMAVFCEVLRLYPPVPIQMKQCSEEETLPDGTRLPKLSLVIWCLWAMNRSKRTWGVDAESFRPERWLRDGKLVNKSPSEYPVFNGGPRTCLGKKMAEAVAVQVIATMAWLFDFILVDDKERVSKPSLTLPMEGGLPCHVKTRSPALDLG
jgi:cytochrome P450